MMPTAIEIAKAFEEVLVLRSTDADASRRNLASVSFRHRGCSQDPARLRSLLRKESKQIAQGPCDFSPEMPTPVWGIPPRPQPLEFRPKPINLGHGQIG